MSDNIKLIIEIDKDCYEAMQKTKAILGSPRSGKTLTSIIYSAVCDGTPLDSVRADMEKTKRFHVGTFEDDNPIDHGIVEGINKAIAILDNVGNSESEVKPNEM